MKIVTVCTGNICRSPLVEQVLRAQLTDFAPARDGRLTFGSAGTIADAGQSMPEQAAEWSTRLGGDPSSHGATFLTEGVLSDASLVLAMSREHRTKVVAMVPSLLRRTFTLREFERLAGSVSEAQLREAVQGPFVTQTPEGRLGAVLGAIADARATGDPAMHLADPEEDDVVDPYRRGDEVYALAAQQMVPGINAVARALTFDFVWQDE